MNYQVLARKWRPQNFAEMVGQHHVLRALKNALDGATLHHAYLFTGTRGVGKTTLARILAMCLNCEMGITSTPCGTCSACRDIREGKFADLIEVDAASRTKVEQTRELLENVAYAPLRGRFKIYLIDEVHMLSTHSFNALLKTLEEPPEHVKFLLATTDPERLPPTVLSRCLHFHLKNMPAAMISAHMAHILTAEQIAYTADALDLIAHAAEGSMRDALSLLDQAIAYGAGQINLQEVRELLGHIDPQAILQILQALQAKDAKALLQAVQSGLGGADHQALLDALITVLHQLAVVQMLPETAPDLPALAPFAQCFSPEEVQLFYQIALNGRKDLPWVANPRLGLEMIVLRMLAFYPETTAMPEPKPAAMSAPLVAAAPAPAPIVTVKETPIPTPTPPAPTPVLPSTNKSLAGLSWAQVSAQLGLTGLAMALASHCVLKSFQDTLVQLALAPQHAPLLNSSSATRIEAALTEYLGVSVRLKISLEDTFEETLATQQMRTQQLAQQTAEADIKADPKVQALVQRLGAQVLTESITSR
ncbi:MAG TPA: DNA polymerase III subunit gamma/tau [Gammaproteobacteria bacterium]|nr:DNA polymerase III subunit gamma/tau [Gammaproteobacteria bacterium]